MSLKNTLLFFLLTVLLSSCLNSNQQNTNLIARVGEEELTREILLPLIPKDISKEDREFFVKQLVESWIENQLLVQQAREDGFQLSTKEKWQVNKLKKELLATQFLQNRLQNSFQIPDDEILSFYEKNKDHYRRSQNEVHLQHLFFEKLDKAIVDEIKQSGSLAQVIEKNNYLGQKNDVILEANGDLGFLAISELRSEFRKAIEKNKKSGIFGPIKTRDGHHYLQVISRKEKGSVRDVELVKGEIIAHLRMQKRQESIKRLREELQKKYPVETFYDNVL
ncbi:MAG: peptidyl-prolyl cis-trans isomerase [Calditrichia bacterium]